MARLLLPRPQYQCPNGKASFRQGRVSGHDLLSGYLFSILLVVSSVMPYTGCSPHLLVEGTFSSWFTWYGSCLLTKGCCCSRPRRNCNVSFHERLICCIRKQIPHPDSLLTWITCSSSKLLSGKFKRGMHKSLMPIVCLSYFRLWALLT